MKTMFLANNVYGKHGGPYQPGTAIGFFFTCSAAASTNCKDFTDT